MRLKSSLPAALKYQALIIENEAKDAGLDFFDVVFELLDACDVNGIASYAGFPVRFPSWRFGMEFERLQKGYDWGLSKIYELVINNDPTYAYLVKSNSLMEQKLVMAHVYGHADFFKHNVWFGPTDRHMLDTMGNHATQVRRYIDAFGQDKVETFMDLALSIETLIDPYMSLRDHKNRAAPQDDAVALSERARRSLDALTASPLFATSQGERRESRPVEVHRRWLPTYDVMGFLAEHASLEPWQHDLLRLVRREAYYFSPQRMTKIMNEGWASFWHSRILTGGVLDPSEVLDFADCHSGATAAAPGQLNPYKLGIALFREAEERGEDIFRLRRIHNDVSLIDKLVDEDFARRHFPYGYRQRPGEDGRVDWVETKANLLLDLSWGGLPKIELVDVDAEGRGELLLLHHHDGRDLQLQKSGETLKHLSKVWGGPVHLMTLEEGEGRLLACEDGELSCVESGQAAERCG